MVALERAVAQVSEQELGVARAALGQRLGEVARVLELSRDGDPGALLERLVGRIAESLDTAEAWLLLTAVSTVFPSEDEVRALVRSAELDSVTTCTLRLLADVLPAAQAGRLDRELLIVTGGVVVDVDFSARNDHTSGIQRVVRNTVPEWTGRHALTLVAWGEDGRSWREVTASESERVGGPIGQPEAESELRLVVPWRSTVILVEVPTVAERCLPLATLARFSGNRTTAIGYDLIPIASAETVPLGMADHFGKYLALVKNLDRIAGISATATTEFASFAGMLAAQGVTGPRVSECSLPSSTPASLGPAPTGRPLVLCVGGREPRKNHAAVLASAEHLWRDGLDFELRFIGSEGWDTRDFRAWIARLERAGRPVSVPAFSGDEFLWQSYRDARFCIFPSLHEGYGLPVAEALSVGTPAITSFFGSTAEIGEGGGCLLVDPRSDSAITEAMRSLLVDDTEYTRLRAKITGRPSREWSDYADDLWSQLVEPA